MKAVFTWSTCLGRQLVTHKAPSFFLGRSTTTMSQNTPDETIEKKPIAKWKSGTDYVEQTEGLGAGDSYLKLNLLPPDIESDVFEKLKEEVKWQKMYHHGGEVPRLVAVEGEIQPEGWYVSFTFCFVLS